MNAAQFVVAQLQAWGVERVYGLPGDTILELVDALARAGRPRLVTVRHEASAALMASAEAKLTGRPGCCIATSGPGTVNLLNGLGDAALDGAPVLAITGQVPRDRVGTDAKQYLDQQPLLLGIGAWSAPVASERALPRLLALAWRAAMGGGGVAHLTVPADLWKAPVPEPVRQPEPFLGTRHRPADEVVRGAVRLMAEASRPAVVCGHGARPARGSLMELAERWQAPILRSLGGIGVVPGRHALSVGGYGEGGSGAAHRLLQEADVALVVGSTWWPRGHVPAHLRIVQVDLRPANIGRDVEVAWGIVGDAAEVVPLLARQLPAADRRGWLERARRLREQWEAQLAQAVGAQPTSEAGDGPLEPGRLIEELERALAPDGVVVLDVGDHVLWFNQFFRGEAQHVLFSGTWRGMGFAVPAAVAAALCQPGRQVVALVGDGGLAMAAGELATAAWLGVAVTWVVADNGWWAMEKNRMEGTGLASAPTRLAPVDWVRLAEASGLRAWRVTRADQLGRALREALGCGAPALVDVAVQPGPPPSPAADGQA